MKLTLLAIAALIASAALADPLTLFTEKRLVSPAQLTLPFDLPAVPAGQQARLSLKARVDMPTFGGHNPFLGVQINGHPLTPTQLVNKPVEFTMNDGSDASWWGQGTWRLLYSPSFDAFFKEDPPEYMIADADPYGFVWDITSFVKPGANTLHLWHPQLLLTPTTCVVADATVEVGQPLPPPSSPSAAAAADPTASYEPARPQAVNMKVQLHQGGTIEVAVGRRALRVVTLTSEPEGKWRTTAAAGGSALKRGATGSATWSGTGYRVSRKVTVEANHLHVADTITNTTDQPSGLRLRHRLQTADQPPSSRLIAGRRVYKKEQTIWSPGNPTALAIWPDVAVGLVAEDDILRIHNESFTNPEGLGLSDNRLGFAPGVSHTLEWELYVLPKGDYWQFINAIRRDWAINITIPGPSCIANPEGDKPAVEVAKWAQGRQLSFVIAGQQALDDGILAEGTAIPLGHKWNANFTQWRNKLRQAQPGLKVLQYLHSEISTEPDALTKYADCKVMDAAGKQQVSPYTYPVYLFLPRPDNAYGQALTKTVEFMLDDMKADGIYNDCFTHDSAAWMWGGAWDGCTITIDPQTHAVGRPYSSVVLLQQPWKLQLARMCRQRHKLLTGNGPLYTRTMLREGVPTFTETNSFAFLVDTHLSCPWGLGTHNSEQTTPARATMARRMLDYGGVYSVYAWLDEPGGEQFIQYFFPTTPIELHPGVLIAQERILTNRSGRFGWGDRSHAEVHVFDAEGNPVRTRGMVKELQTEGRVLTEVTVPTNGFAALLRKR